MSLPPRSYYSFRRLLLLRRHSLPIAAADSNSSLLSSLTTRSCISKEEAPLDDSSAFSSRSSRKLLFGSDLGLRGFTVSATNRTSGIKRPFALEVIRSMSSSAQAKVAPSQGRQVALRVTMLSPGFVYEPYKPREPMPFWQRWFTLSGWRRTKGDIMMEAKNAYAIAKLKKASGYTRKAFYQEAIKLYKEINTLLANGDKASLRKLVTENMFSNFKNEIKRRDSIWSSVYWEFVEPIVSIRTRRARLICIDKSDLDKAFVQLTLELQSKQKFEAYNADGIVVAGDKSKEVLVRDFWVFEKSLFHSGSRWRLCARLSP